jgi:NAD(P)-dependent dehydrogenase (short-subunit alcohol dehydrogenase family)
VKLEGRVAIVTGGGGQGALLGVGRAACHVLSREGAKLIVVDQSEAAAAVTVEEVVSQGGLASAVVGDIRQTETSRQAAERAYELYGGVNILVNSAAIIGPAVDSDDDDASGSDQVMAVNARGAMLMAKHSVPHMPKGSSIINIGSISAFRSSTRMAYAASKGAIASMTGCHGGAIRARGYQGQLCHSWSLVSADGRPRPI